MSVEQGVTSREARRASAAGARVLLVDDHQDMARGVADYLAGHGYATETATAGSEALARFASSSFDAVITDLRMPGMDGLDLLDAIHRVDPHVPVFIMTAFGTIDSALEAVKRGAYHYFSKPLNTDEVLLYLGRSLEHRRLARAQARLLAERRDPYSFESMVARSPDMRRVFDLIDRVADAASPALITGESGTGKELVARAIHFRGARATSAFVPVNCAAIPATLLESELFGFEKGAFTGAHKPRAGLVVEASGGTLFLDEIGDLPLELQPKLLRLLQESEVRPIGSDTSRKVDVRVVAATHADLAALVDAGTFRRDLFYRLNVVPIDVPPLRERLEDVPLLADRVLSRLRESSPRLRAVQLGAEALEVLLRYDWPGNVRELENVLERAATLCTGDVIGAGDLAFLKRAAVPRTALTVTDDFPSLREMEQRYIERVLDHVGGNKIKASAILGIDPSTLYRRSKRSTGR